MDLPLSPNFTTLTKIYKTYKIRIPTSMNTTNRLLPTKTITSSSVMNLVVQAQKSYPASLIEDRSMLMSISSAPRL